MPPSPSEIMERVMENEAEIVGVKRDLEHGKSEFARLTDAIEGIREDFKVDMKDIRDDFKSFSGWVRALVLGVSGALILFGADTIKELLTK